MLPPHLLHKNRHSAEQIGGVFNGGEGVTRRATGHPRRCISPAKNFRKRRCCAGHQRPQALEQRTPSHGTTHCLRPCFHRRQNRREKKEGAGAGTTRNPGMTPQQTNSAHPRQQSRPLTAAPGPRALAWQPTTTHP